MPRYALLVSLMLHGGVLVLVGSRTPPAAMTGDPGVGVSFASENARALLLAESGPAAPPDSQAAPVPMPQFSPTVDVVTGVSSPASTAISIPGEPEPADSIASLKKNSRPARRISARNGGNATGLRGSTAGGGGRGYAPPQFRVRYKPPYPAAARAQRLEGTVVLLVEVDASGRVTGADLQRSCGHAALDRAALDAVRAWRFDPARQDGVAVRACVEIPVRFRFS